jgi:predicted DNA-binding transcriptional regulator YafY
VPTSVPVSKAERLLDLVIALLNSRYYRTAAWIRDHVAGYRDAPGGPAGDAAFARMFERDKQELRDLGIPIETDAAGDGYRIRPADFALPPLTLTPAEAAALAVASRLWETTVLADAGSAALRKVRDAAESATGSADGADSDGAYDPDSPLQRLQARLRTSEPSFGDLYQAIRARRGVQFYYRGVADTHSEPRSVEPWGMVNYRGVWYMVGHDTDRNAPRTFRLSRISGAVTVVGRSGAVAVPPGIDLRQFVAAHADSSSSSAALVRIRVGTAAGLRRGAQVLHAAGPGGYDGYDEVRIPCASLSDTARRIAGHGADVLVIDPPELREAVRSLLTGAAR